MHFTQGTLYYVASRHKALRRNTPLENIITTQSTPMWTHTRRAPFVQNILVGLEACSPEMFGGSSQQGAGFVVDT